MKGIGETLRTIRKSLSLTQTQICKEIMSQSNYSKAEKDEIDIPFFKMIKILGRLGMSVDEFLYIHNNYEKKYTHNLVNLNNLKYNDKEQLTQYKEELEKSAALTARDEEFLSIYDALLIIAEDNDYAVAKQKVEIIWRRLEKNDNWYLYDIQLINNILYLFPLETAISIVHLAVIRLKKYKKLRGVNNLSASLQMNLVLLLIQNKQYEKALSEVDILISLCVKKNLYIHLALCYVRKGLLLDLLNNEDSSEWYKKGYGLLEVMHNHDLKEELEKEVFYYFSDEFKNDRD